VPILLVGRSAECDVQIEDESVADLHCVVVNTEGQLLLLRDLGSANGTRVNGQCVRRGALLPNDELAIGRFRFRVQNKANGEQ
jgi:pSer/pThr/pTyr-binding forkhead associated (FHA) protein